MGGFVDLIGYKESLNLGLIEGDKVVRAPLDDGNASEIMINGGNI